MSHVTCHRVGHACHMSQTSLHGSQSGSNQSAFRFLLFFNLRQKVGLISPGFYKTLAKGSTFLQTKLVGKKPLTKRHIANKNSNLWQKGKQCPKVRSGLIGTMKRGAGHKAPTTGPGPVEVEPPPGQGGKGSKLQLRRGIDWLQQGMLMPWRPRPRQQQARQLP